MTNRAGLWVRIGVLLLSTLCAVASVAQGSASEPEWGRLLDANKPDQAQLLCEGMTHSSDLGQRVEAQKCLANVALCRGATTMLAGDPSGGVLRSSYTREAADVALQHLNEGIRLAPQDISIHMGRLHVLEVTGRFDEMVKALEETLSVYKGADAMHEFLQYVPELWDMRAVPQALSFSLVLDRHFPNEHEIIGNIGALYNALGDQERALPYLRRAVELDPKDAMDAWNLGWALKAMNRNQEADLWMRKSMQLHPDATGMEDRACLYARFVETNLKQRERACALERKSCEKEQQTACAASPAKKK